MASLRKGGYGQQLHVRLPEVRIASVPKPWIRQENAKILLQAIIAAIEWSMGIFVVLNWAAGDFTVRIARLRRDANLELGSGRRALPEWTMCLRERLGAWCAPRWMPEVSALDIHSDVKDLA